MLGASYVTARCTGKQKKVGVSQVDDSDKHIPGTSRDKSRFSALKCSTRGIYPGTKLNLGKKHREEAHRTFRDHFTFQNLLAFPASPGKFHRANPACARKTGGNPVSKVGPGVRTEGTLVAKAHLPRICDLAARWQNKLKGRARPQVRQCDGWGCRNSRRSGDAPRSRSLENGSLSSSSR